MQMHRPRVVKETRRAVEQREPPTRDRLRAHPWLSEESRAVFDAAVESEAPLEFYLSTSGESKIREHAQAYASRRLEVMGFLLGEVASWGGRQYSVARDVVTTELKSSISKVRFDPGAFPQLFHGLDGSGFDYVLVGWYHSHPGHTCFLSRTDLETQRSIFSRVTMWRLWSTRSTRRSRHSGSQVKDTRRSSSHSSTRPAIRLRTPGMCVRDA